MALFDFAFAYVLYGVALVVKDLYFTEFYNAPAYTRQRGVFGKALAVLGRPIAHVSYPLIAHTSLTTKIVALLKFALPIIALAISVHWGRQVVQSEPFYRQAGVEESAEFSNVPSNTYRNPTYGYEIDFPEQWEIRSGDGTVQAVWGDKRISVLAGMMPEEGAGMYTSITDIYSPEESRDLVMSGYQEGGEPPVQLLDYGKTMLGTEPAYWVKMLLTASSSSGSDGAPSHAVYTQYSMFSNNTIYTISLDTLGSDYGDAEADMLASVETFRVIDRE